MPNDGTANLRPTSRYVTWQLAESLGKTVRELLTGAPGPLTNLEWYLWTRFKTAQARIQQQRGRR